MTTSLEIFAMLPRMSSFFNEDCMGSGAMLQASERREDYNWEHTVGLID